MKHRVFMQFTARDDTRLIIKLQLFVSKKLLKRTVFKMRDVSCCFEQSKGGEIFRLLQPVPLVNSRRM